MKTYSDNKTVRVSLFDRFVVWHLICRGFLEVFGKYETDWLTDWLTAQGKLGATLEPVCIGGIWTLLKPSVKDGEFVVQN